MLPIPHPPSHNNVHKNIPPPPGTKVFFSRVLNTRLLRRLAPLGRLSLPLPALAASRRRDLLLYLPAHERAEVRGVALRVLDLCAAAAGAGCRGAEEALCAEEGFVYVNGGPAEVGELDFVVSFKGFFR